MKKLIFLLMAVVIGNTTFAQGKADKKAKPATEKASAKADKKADGKDVQKADAGKTGGKMKKDGTPDMRYKENKEKKAAGPMKKDGTPDMRYKANKDAAKKKGDKK